MLQLNFLQENSKHLKKYRSANCTDFSSFFEPCGNQSGVMVAGRPRQSIGGGRVPQNQHQLWPKLHHIIDFKPHLQLFLHPHPLNLDCGGKNSI